MKDVLPDLGNFVIDQFIYCENVNAIMDESQIGSDFKHPVFFKHNDEIFFLSIKTLQLAVKYSIPVNELPWQHAAAVSVSDDWYHIQQKSRDTEALLVHDGTMPAGYIESKQLLHHVLSTYNTLLAYHQTILDTMEGSISVIDENKNTVVWTNGAEKIFSIKKKEIIGQPMNKFFPEKMLECFKTLETGQSVLRKQHQPREDLFVLINTNPIMINNQIVGVVVAETDVTSQVRLNEQLADANNRITHLQNEVLRMTPAKDPFFAIKGSSPAIKKTLEKIKLAGTTEARVLILGESGVGKELFAKALHDFREKKGAPFIALNCGAIPPSLFESELFGYEKGAFSGADAKGRKGKFEIAHGGTLFLDEIGELPLDMQVKLLRVLQENKYYRVGGTRQQTADCRVIAATNKPLEELVKKGKFRDDLYYRLNIVSIKIPPLKERTQDIVELSHLFLYEYATKYNRNVKEIPKEIMSELLYYKWPGNIRELRNTIERLVVFASDGQLDKDDLPFKPENKEQMDNINTKVKVRKPGMTLKESLNLLEKEIIEDTIHESNGNKITVAKELGVSRATLYNKMNKLGIPN
ncbi:PAS domain S-box-containing protein [Scopulibacillus darangshiensis]|uniref:PAS domain S-box-containing protein n=1 Tax=Scopulibacillus darangshiensis TaxID=442528 RepID=A0A4R2NQ03_9BACL|nr:sigma 54-interacting transcriptional regulator [Scopulibacillus darangshiensis]TCP23448.1 PAS domain S-box-containing protein [Scopulibacillus darangshiensis]